MLKPQQKAKTAAVFHNVQRAIPIHHMLHHLGYPQPPTPITIDNSTTDKFIKDDITEKRSIYWDMRYYWQRDQAIQKIQFFI